MAVYNDYVDAKILANRIAPAQSSQGVKAVHFLVSFVTVAAHDAGSIYRVLRGIPCTAVPYSFWIVTDGVTAMNDVDVCLYKTMVPGSGVAGAEVGTEVLASAIDLSSSVARTAPKDGLGNITHANWGKPLWELAGQTREARETSYDIGLKSVADLSEADEICCYGVFLLP